MAQELPPELAGALRPVLPDLAEAIITAIAREVPPYAQPLEGPFGRALRAGVEQALERFVDSVADPGALDAGTRETYVALGRGEMRQGRSLDALQKAYRIGARLAWERFVAAGEVAGHEPQTLYRLASAIFEYIDGISAESVEGFTEERAAAEGERQRRRRTLAHLLAREDAAAEEVREAARAAGWRRPERIGALVAGPGPATAVDADRLASRLGVETIAVTEGPLVVAWLPDPEAPARRAQLDAALDGARATLGPAVALERAAQSLARARAAHALVLEGLVAGDALVVADEHLPALLLHGGDPALATDLAARALAPLDELGRSARARLEPTLRAWLDHPGQVSRMAGELHVHPQTVRYRLGQLRELFGARLDDPDARFELALALRAQPV
jgi:PucR C-terminal helix-turn-helix domain